MSVYETLRVDSSAPGSLADQLARQLAWLIASGEIREGERLPAVRALGSQLGINFHTVRAAYLQLESDGLVATRRGSQATVLGYKFAAIYTHDLPTFTIGALIPLQNPFYAPYIHGIQSALQSEPWLLVTCDTTYRDQHPSDRALNQLLAKGVDGLIITSHPAAERIETAVNLSAAGKLPPIVHADSPDAPGYGVVFDLEDGGYKATWHLVEHGHRRIGLIVPPLEWDNIREAYQGYERALASEGISRDPELVISGLDFSPATGARAAQTLLDLPEPPTAIFARGDALAIGAIQGIKARGLSVPEDIAVIGLDNLMFSELTDPPLTTIHLPAREMGITAMTMLQKLIAGEPMERQRVILETTLIVRRSCGC